MREVRLGLPDLGVGVGLRVPHYGAASANPGAVDFLEIISENFMVQGGKPRYHLDRVLETHRIVPHGVSLGIGNPESVDRSYLATLKELVRHLKAPWVSDHCCWSGAGGAHLHDLLPLPHTLEAVNVVVERARMIQDYLEVPFALENTSSYLAYTASTMTEWEFVSEIVERANIGLLFDVNNVFVNAANHEFDALDFVKRVPHDRIVQIHVAGHTDRGKYLLDTHRGPIVEPVWELYRETLRLTGPVSTIIAWDDEIPTFDVLVGEVDKARAIRRSLAQERIAEAREPSPAMAST